MEPRDLQAITSGEPLDRPTIDRLAAADPQALREMLSEYLPDAQVEAILRRIQQLVEAAKNG